MTEKELNQLYWLKKEIRHLDERLKRLENMSLVGSPIITGMPSGSKINDSVSKYSCNVVDLARELITKRQKCVEQECKIEKYIESIEDSEIRHIVRLRHAEGLSWEEIGQELNMHRTTVTRKYSKFIKVAHNAHSTCAIV